MMKHEQLIIKKSELQAHTEYELEVLRHHTLYYLSFTYEKKNDELILTFDMQDTKALSEYRNDILLHKYCILLSLKSFVVYPRLLKFTLEPSNLYVDHTFHIWIQLRDIYDDFYQINLNECKALCGYLLQECYSYEDYYYGGMDLLKENEITNDFFDVQTIEELMILLENKITEERQKETHMIRISSMSLKKMRFKNYIFQCLSVILFVAFLYFGVYCLHTTFLFNQAQEAYIQQDYLTVIETLENVKVSRMNKSLWTLLAESVVKSESLSQEQKNNILSQISFRSDERLLKYWIFLGKNEIDDCIDLAHQLNNQEYLAYAYMKKQQCIENDSQLDIREKQEQIDEIKNLLEKIGQDYE